MIIQPYAGSPCGENIPDPNPHHYLAAVIPVIEIQFFGPVAAYRALMPARRVELERYECFQKMSYRNRMQLLGPHGVQNLSIPIVGGREKKGVPIMEVEVDYSGRWMAEHWRSLESWYNRSPFFFHYGPMVKELLEQQPPLLWDLARNSQVWALRQLGWEGVLAETEQWNTLLPEGGKDYRNHFLPRHRMAVAVPPYQQVFGTGFESNLSVLDLLFNLGPDSYNYLLNETV